MHMMDGMKHPLSYLKNGIAAMDYKLMGQLLIPLALLGVYDYVALEQNPLMLIHKMPAAVKNTIYAAFLLMVLLLASFNSQEFVYFQF